MFACHPGSVHPTGLGRRGHLGPSIMKYRGKLRRTRNYSPSDWTSSPNRACVVAKGAATIDPELLQATLKAHISEMRGRLEEAADIAKEANACADADNIGRSDRDCAGC
jgi:hypothetical protein